MLTPFIRRQLIAFGILTVVSLLVLGMYYLRLPSLAGIGQYTLKAELPASGGLYPTANVTYRGITIGKVTDVEPTEQGAEATMSIMAAGSDEIFETLRPVFDVLAGQCSAAARSGRRRESRSSTIFWASPTCC